MYVPGPAATGSTTVGATVPGVASTGAGEPCMGVTLPATPGGVGIIGLGGIALLGIGVGADGAGVVEESGTGLAGIFSLNH